MRTPVVFRLTLPVTAACVFVLAVGLSPSSRAADAEWWKHEPIRFLQTNLSENDSSVDPKTLVNAVADFGANTFLMNMGGIVAQYPTRIPFHYPSGFLPPGRDLFGDVVREAHARRIRVVGRFDLSKTQKAVFDAHPEWFFRRADGEPVIYNGLYSTCINGKYYREHALTILAEALERYEVDGLFFNMFGNPTTDYSGVATGPCHCQACEARFRARFGRGVPSAADADYRSFMSDSSREVAATIAELIHRKRPGAAFLTYIKDHTDGIISESNTAVGRPLPLWPYSASDNVSRSLGSEPDKVAINLAMTFIDFPWRYSNVPGAETALRLYQNIAHGAPPAIVVSGPMAQQDRSGLLAAKPIFDWHAHHEDLYVGQKNGARVMLLARGDTASYRGFFRLLTEEHIPFVVSENLRWMEEGSRFDLVISPGAPPAELGRYVQEGGRVLVAGTAAPPFPVGAIVGRRSTQGYWRIHDRREFPSLKDTDLIFIDGEYLEIAPPQHPILTLIPTAMFGPPEKVWSDKVETTVPGIVLTDHGKGRAAYIPWDVGGLYYRHSSETHRGLVTDVIDRLLPGERQLRTNAHPLVEMTVMDQAAPASTSAEAPAGSRRSAARGGGRTLIHLVNGTGHHDTAYFPPLEIRDIRIDLARDVHRVHAVALDRDLPITSNGRLRSFTVPRLQAYEVIVVE